MARTGFKSILNIKSIFDFEMLDYYLSIQKGTYLRLHLGAKYKSYSWDAKVGSYS